MEILPKGGANAPVSKRDIMFVSYPKSGNTWLRFIMANLISAGVQRLKELDVLVPDIHAYGCLKYMNKDVNFLKSHLQFQPNYGKVVYLVRDPRSVCISQFHFLKRRGRIGENDSFEKFFENFLIGFEDRFGSWGENVGSWVGGKSQDILFIRYEDLRANASDEVRKICQFIGLEKSDEEIDKAVENSSMERMRKGEAKRKTNIPFVRKGASNEWQDYLDESKEKRLLETFGQHMAHFGYC